MTSIISSLFRQDIPKEITIICHHKVEIINPKSHKKSGLPTTIKNITDIAAKILFFLGAMMILVAGAAFSIESAGLSAPALPILANLLMPGITAILTGLHLSKENLQTDTILNLPSPVPGLRLRL